MSRFSNKPDDMELSPREKDMEEFHALYKMEINRKKRRHLLEVTEEGYVAYKAGIDISFGCRQLDLEKAYKAYLTTKALNVTLNVTHLSNLLSLASGLGELGHGSTTVRRVDPPQDINKAFVLYEEMLQHHLIPTEAAYSALVRCCCQHDLIEKALTIYNELLYYQITPKLRTIAPLIQYLASHPALESVNYSIPIPPPVADIKTQTPHQKNTSFGEETGATPTEEETVIPKYTETESVTKSAFAQSFLLYDDLQKEENNIDISEREYANLLSLCVYHQDMRFYEVFEALKEDLLVIQYEQTFSIVKEWFGRVWTTDSMHCTTSMVEAGGRIEVNDEVLQSIDLSNEQRELLLNQLEQYAIDRDPQQKHKLNNKIKDTIALFQQQKQDTIKEGTTQDSTKPAVNTSASTITDHPRAAEVDSIVVEEHKVKKAKVHHDGTTTSALSSRADQWFQYTQWLASHPKGFNVILDGANIGYYKQNYANAPLHVNYWQIQKMLDMVVNEYQLKPIILLHARHIHNLQNTIPDMKTRQEVQAMITAWQSSHYLFATPKGWNDDWFWLYACMKYAARNTSDGCMVITNDEMRDHHFQLLSPRFFTRWRERHRVSYEMFYDFHGPHEFTLRNIKLSWPLKYSYRIQYIHTAQYEGYYFPPIISPPTVVTTELSAEDTTENKVAVETMHNKHQGVEGEGDGEGKAVSISVAGAFTSSNIPVIRDVIVPHIDKPWYCIYRTISSS